MKKILSLFTLVAFVATFVHAQDNPAAAPAPAATSLAVMTLEKTEVDYGTIEKGSDPLRIFKFKNTGSEPLVIKNAKGSCGCTVPSYPKEPIMPGETSQIEVRYDTQRVGPFTKTVTLTTNETSDTRVLTIKGVVKDKPAEESVPASQPSVISTDKH